MLLIHGPILAFQFSKSHLVPPYPTCWSLRPLSAPFIVFSRFVCVYGSMLTTTYTIMYVYTVYIHVHLSAYLCIYILLYSIPFSRLILILFVAPCAHMRVYCLFTPACFSLFFRLPCHVMACRSSSSPRLSSSLPATHWSLFLLPDYCFCLPYLLLHYHHYRYSYFKDIFSPAHGATRPLIPTRF